MSFINSEFARHPLHSLEEFMACCIDVADELDMPDRRGAAVLAAMCAFQEAGADPWDDGTRHIWTPGNDADPAFHANPDDFPHDSMGDDGASTGPYQQQAGATWGWGGHLGDPEGTRRRMDMRESTRLFMGHPTSGLKAKGYTASTAQTANDSIQRVQDSGVPWAYAQWWGIANQLYDAVTAGTPTTPSTSGGTVSRPDFNEYQLWSDSSQDRSEAKVDLFLLHTQEGGGGDDAADKLARYLADPANQASYHYAISQAADGGVTVVDVVDTDRASWSVLSANDRSINLCFAGSRAAWSTDQWMQQAKAIDVAAYLAVQDCGKYGIPLTVIAPPYTAGRAGISDHNYVTQVLKDGTHTDVGLNFPWTYFGQRVAFWAAGGQAPPAAVKKLPQDLTDRELLEDIWTQLRGPGGGGWPQLGANDKGQNLTLVDAIAVQRKDAS